MTIEMNKKGKRVIKATVIIGLFLFLTSFSYISYIALNPATENFTQLSRIDFKTKLTAKNVVEIKSVIKKFPAIESHFLNQKEGTLVYIYNNEKLNSTMVTQEFEKFNNNALQAVPYMISAAQCKTGCPMSVSNTEVWAKILRQTIAIFK